MKQGRDDVNHNLKFNQSETDPHSALVDFGFCVFEFHCEMNAVI